MQKSVPFEFGALYRQVDSSKFYPSIVNNRENGYGLNESLNSSVNEFEPIAFIESRQVVIGNMQGYVNINTLQKDTNYYGNSIGINFTESFAQLCKKFTIEIPVKDFIEGFEKIL